MSFEWYEEEIKEGVWVGCYCFTPITIDFKDNKIYLHTKDGSTLKPNNVSAITIINWNEEDKITVGSD